MVRLNEDRATRYRRGRLRADLGARAAALAVLAPAALTGAGAALADASETAVAGAPAAWLAATLLFVVVLATLIGIARFPFDLFADWTLERRYGLERLPFGRWLTRYAREAVVAAGLAGAAAVAIRGSYVAAPGRGWVLAAAVLWAGHLGWSLAVPRLLARHGGLQPLARPGLRDRLAALGRRLGAPIEVAEWPGGEARQAHAILAGVGRDRRVILSRALLDTLSEDEIEVVVAHELAHQVHRDAWRLAAWRLAVLTAAMGAAAAAYRALAGPLALSSPAALAALPLLGLAAAAAAAVLAPAGQALSRRLERRADAFAVRATGNPGALASAIRRLAAINLLDERPGGLARLLASHPPIADRMAVAARADRR